MNIKTFSPHIFWSYKKDADLPMRTVIRQILAYGEVSDLVALSKKVQADKIHQEIIGWKGKDRYRKRINFMEKVILNDEK